MNLERLLRDVEARLAALDEPQRAEVLDAVREAFARERRRLDPAFTVETERERRLEAEETREAVAAIGRHADMDEALAEALRQLLRIAEADEIVVAAAEPGAGFRVVSTHGEDALALADSLLTDARLPALAGARATSSVGDAEAENAPDPLGLARPLRSWLSLPLLQEGEVVGVLVAGRRAALPFDAEDLHRAKPIAMAAASVLTRGQRYAQLRRYATLLEQVVDLSQAVFRGATPEAVGQALLESACRIGGYRAGMLIVQGPHGPQVGAATGEGYGVAVGRAAPGELAPMTARRLGAARMLEVAEALGVVLPAQQSLLVPLVTVDAYVGCLVLLDPGGESPDDRLMEAFASRAAVAWRHAAARAALR
jgi:GAF domain-containing protein